MVETGKFVLKTVSLRFHGADMRLELSHALFSSNDIDVGSKLLLKAVAKEADPQVTGSILDIGSGVGVLGIACALAYPGAAVTFRDRDALACAFTERNARLNKVKPAAVEHALFLEGLDGREFDLVVCNVPAKAGPPILDKFLGDLPRVVSARGLGAVVVVNTIADAARASLDVGLAGSGFTVQTAEAGRGHTVFLFGRSGLAPLRSGPDSLYAYRRTEASRFVKPGSHRHAGYWGLPEFDTPSFASDLSMELCEAGTAGALVRRVAVINPGSGRLAAFIRARTNAVVDICGRDALALVASSQNLALNGSAQAPPVSSCLKAAWPGSLPDASYDLLAEYADITPRVDTMEDSWNSASRLLKAGAAYVAVMTSADFDRFERKRPKGFAKIREKKKKGWTAGLWRLEPR